MFCRIDLAGDPGFLYLINLAVCGASVTACPKAEKTLLISKLALISQVDDAFMAAG